MKKCILIIAFMLIFTLNAGASPTVECKSALLMEQTTGKVLFEHNAHEPLPPASVTKIMTMLLTMEAIENGRLAMDETVIASERAKSMGGSTIFLDTGEQMSVHDLLKGIAVASGNDACVAIGEHIAGSEQGFVDMMNARAAGLGMINTHFENTNGLDSDNHYISAYDIAVMSRELLKYPQIFEFTTIWTDTLRGGATDLANTNRLIRFYSGANGLKTGSTSKAGYCLSGTAKRDDMQLIAVVMGAETSTQRFESCKALLDYGFANYTIARPAEDEQINAFVSVKKGVSDKIVPVIDKDFEALVDKSQKSQIKSKVELEDEVSAPIEKGDVLGKIIFTVEDEVIGECNLIAGEDIARKTFGAIFLDVLAKWLR